METAVDQAWTRGPGETPAVDGRLCRPDLVMIGATGRDAGKTELACRLIRRFGDATPVVGLKVTTVERTDGHCPHGGDGCGACSSLGEPWMVTRELDDASPKDTCRLLAGGARRVYWLRALRSQLANGAADLLTRVPSGWVGVCESSSLASVVEPGLFLMVRAAGSTGVKPSTRAVAHLADLMVVSDGQSFDLDLERISVVGGHWALRREASAIVIAGMEGPRAAHSGAALRRTRASLERQFDRVLTVSVTGAPGNFCEPASPLPDPPGAWCLVTPPLANGVPPVLVNAMFRRRAGVGLVVATTRTEERNAGLALCRRELLPEVIAALGRTPDALTAFGHGFAARTVVLQPTGDGAGRLSATSPRPSPACRAGGAAP